MSVPRITLDTVIDDVAFDTAVLDLTELIKNFQNLRAEMEAMINTLKNGFNTPAGVKFINSCEKNLFKPMDDQKIVLEHISTTLSESRQAYESVFDEYGALQQAINQLNKK